MDRQMLKEDASKDREELTQPTCPRTPHALHSFYRRSISLLTPLLSYFLSPKLTYRYENSYVINIFLKGQDSEEKAFISHGCSDLTDL